MARPNRPPEKPPTFLDFLPAGMEATKVETSRIEKEDERALRLHKERLSFYIKDLAVYVMGFALVIALVGYSFGILFQKTSSKEDRQFAMAILASAASAIFGIVFGKSLK